MPALVHLPLSSPLVHTNHPSSFLSPHLLYIKLRNRKIGHAFRPSSSLKETKKASTLQKASSSAGLSKNLRIGNSQRKVEAEDGGLEGETAVKGTILAGLLLFGVVGGFGAVGYVYRDQINAFLTQFSGTIEGMLFGCQTCFFFFFFKICWNCCVLHTF